MVNKNSKKTGFTLIEILIALIILTVFFLAAAKILTVKPKRQFTNSLHGMYECYVLNGTTYSHTVYESYNPKPKTVSGSTCEFSPSKNVAFYNIVVIYPSESDDYDDSTATNDMVPSINAYLELQPKYQQVVSYKSKNDTDSIGYVKYVANKDANMSKNDLEEYLKTTLPKSKMLEYIDNHDGAVIMSW